jgi:hypothetical protein
MSRSIGLRRGERGDCGFALLALLLVVGAGSLWIVLAAQQFVPALADRALRTEAGLAQVAAAVRDGFVANGSYPGSLDAIGVQNGWPAQGAWRRDPWGAGQEWGLAGTVAGLQVQSRGPDGLLGTADDLRLDALREPLVRVRQRDLLRLVRAVYVRRLQADVLAAATALGGGAPSGLVGAIRTYALARRQWLGADAATRVQLTATMTTAAATVTACQVFAAWSQPAAVTGAGGLFARLGLSDALARDGLGQALRLDAILGVVAVGSDGIWGTDDDM